MKKKASFITIDSSSLNWLIQQLAQAPKQFHNLQELHEEFTDLLDGSITSVMIDTSETGSIESVFPTTFKYKDLEINQRNRVVSMSGIVITLTPKEFDILYFLAQNQGTVFTKEQIYNAVWEEDYFLSDSNIMAFIRKLRKKIEPNPDEPTYILTLWGVGYKFADQE